MNEFDEYYEPEMGQAAFGQPCKQFKISNELEYALAAIETRLMLRMGQIDKNYVSPFRNTGSKFSCDTFSVESYNWDDEVEQDWNFKWRNLEISWYKYVGRGMSANRKMTTKEIEEMLDDCLKAIERIK